MPEWVLDSGVSDRAIRLYGLIAARWADRDGVAWPSRATMAEAMLCSKDSVRRAGQELIEIGALVMEVRATAIGRQTSNLYTIYYALPIDAQDSLAQDARGRRADRGRVAPVRPLEPSPSEPDSVSRDTDAKRPLQESLDRFADKGLTSQERVGVLVDLFTEHYGKAPRAGGRLAKLAKDFGGGQVIRNLYKSLARDISVVGDPLDYITRMLTRSDHEEAPPSEVVYHDAQMREDTARIAAEDADRGEPASEATRAIVREKVRNDMARASVAALEKGAEDD